MAPMQRLQAPFSLPDYSVDAHSVSRSGLESLSKFSRFAGTQPQPAESVMALKYTVALRQNNHLWQEAGFLQWLLQQQRSQTYNIQSLLSQTSVHLQVRYVKKHLQVSQASLANSRGNGLDGSQHGVNELGQLAGHTRSGSIRLCQRQTGRS